eukprot:2299621-Pleurochrysis_carterae.AAC.5
MEPLREINTPCEINPPRCVPPPCVDLARMLACFGARAPCVHVYALQEIFVYSFAPTEVYFLARWYYREDDTHEYARLQGAKVCCVRPRRGPTRRRAGRKKGLGELGEVDQRRQMEGGRGERKCAAVLI